MARVKKKDAPTLSSFLAVAPNHGNHLGNSILKIPRLLRFFRPALSLRPAFLSFHPSAEMSTGHMVREGEIKNSYFSRSKGRAAIFLNFVPRHEERSTFRDAAPSFVEKFLSVLRVAFT